MDGVGPLDRPGTGLGQRNIASFALLERGHLAIGVAEFSVFQRLSPHFSCPNPTASRPSPHGGHP